MPLVRNTTSRLITINLGDDDKTSIQVKPGDNPSVNLPDEAMKIPFVKHLVKSGALLEVAPRAVDVADIDEDEDDELAQLQAEALTLGMDFKESWVASTLKGKIAKFKKEQADGE